MQNCDVLFNLVYLDILTVFINLLFVLFTQMYPCLYQ